MEVTNTVNIHKSENFIYDDKNLQKLVDFKFKHFRVWMWITGERKAIKITKHL